jgi:hypothetical protein
MFFILPRGLALKYFAERINPAIHDGAAKREGFADWKEQFLHWRFERQEVRAS